MTDADRFARAISVLGRAFRQEVDELFLDAYAIGLNEVSIEKTEEAVRRALGECKFMPSPAELKELVGCARLKLKPRPGRFTCAACQVKLEFPESLEVGYCGPCWRSAHGIRTLTWDVPEKPDTLPTTAPRLLKGGDE